jgi:hypothetical protein
VAYRKGNRQFKAARKMGGILLNIEFVLPYDVPCSQAKYSVWVDHRFMRARTVQQRVIASTSLPNVKI